jgi:hypothetical protein
LLAKMCVTALGGRRRSPGQEGDPEYAAVRRRGGSRVVHLAGQLVFVVR